MLYAYLWYFFLYAFLGWCCEVCFAAAKDGVFVNRGFLNGPVCPIYGVGVSIVVLCLTPVREHILYLFVGSVLLTSALEWLTGFVLERVFHQKWWDYSEMPGNLNGYICPLFSLLWGLACLLILRVFHPMIEKLVAWIPHTLGIVLLCVFGAVFLADVVVTILAMAKLTAKLRRLDELAQKIKSISDGIGENLADTTLSIEEKVARGREALTERKTAFDAERRAREDAAEERRGARAAEAEAQRKAREAALRRQRAALAELRAASEELLSTYHFGQLHLLKGLPNMKSLRHGESLEKIRERIRSKSHQNQKGSDKHD